MPGLNPKTRFLTWTVVMVVGIAFWCHQLWGLRTTIHNQSWAVQESMRLLSQGPGKEVLGTVLDTATVARDTMYWLVWLAAFHGFMIAGCVFVIWTEATKFRQTASLSTQPLNR